MSAEQILEPVPPHPGYRPFALCLLAGEEVRDTHNADDQLSEVQLLDDLEGQDRVPDTKRESESGAALRHFADATAEFDAAVLRLNQAYWSDRRAHGAARMKERINNPGRDDEWISPTSKEWERANQERNRRYVQLWSDLGARAGEISLILQDARGLEEVRATLVAAAAPQTRRDRQVRGVDRQERQSITTAL